MDKRNERRFCVYRHVNTINGKMYIGFTGEKPNRRWTNGFGYHNQPMFYNDIIKYGWDKFSHEILFENLTKKEAEDKEVEMILFYKSNEEKYGYNVSIGRKMNQITINKLKEKRIGKNNPMYGKSGELCPSSVKVICEGKVFPSTTACANYYGVKQYNMTRWLKGTRKMPEFYRKANLKYM